MAALGLAAGLAETPNVYGAAGAAVVAEAAAAVAAAAVAAARAAFKDSLLSARPLAIDVKLAGAVLSSSAAILAMVIASN